MKRWIFLFLILLLLGSAVWLLLDSEPKILQGTLRTEAAQVTDRAMSEGLTYLGVQLTDGTCLCLWDPQAKVIPEDLSIGDMVSVTFGIQEGFDRYVVLNVDK